MRPFILILCTIVLAAAAEPSQLTSSEYGFTMRPPAVFNPLLAAQPVSFCLPEHDGFTPNVNVQVQQFAQDLAAFDKFTQAQLVAAKMKLITAKLDADQIVYEYTGTFKGFDLHWYARALKRGDQVFLVTATVAAGDWAATKDALVGSVDSFELKK